MKLIKSKIKEKYEEKIILKNKKLIFFSFYFLFYLNFNFFFLFQFLAFFQTQVKKVLKRWCRCFEIGTVGLGKVSGRRKVIGKWVKIGKISQKMTISWLTTVKILILSYLNFFLKKIKINLKYLSFSLSAMHLIWTFWVFEMKKTYKIGF